MSETSNLLACVEIETGSKPTHTIIWLHGLGADAHDFAPIVPELNLGERAVRFLFPNAPVQPVTINGGMAMRSWYDILVTDLVRQEDGDGIRASEQAIQALIAHENARGIPSSCIVLAGFSQGCAMTLHTGLRLNEKLAGMVALSGYLPLQDMVKEQAQPVNAKTPIFMAHGLYDPVVALSRAEISRDFLKAMQYDVRWNTYAMAHSVCADEVVDISTFLREVLV